MEKLVKIGALALALTMLIMSISCDNLFVKKKLSDINPAPLAPPFLWDNDSVYLDPVGGTSFYPPTISGLLKSSGYKFWLKAFDQVDTESYIEVESDGVIVDEFKAEVLAGDSHIVLYFVPTTDILDSEDLGTEEIWTFNILPATFRGADSDLFDTSAAQLKVTFSIPSIAEYAVRRIEGEDITLAGGEGDNHFAAWPSDSTDDEIIAALLNAIKEIIWDSSGAGDTIAEVFTAQELDFDELTAEWVNKPNPEDSGSEVKYKFTIEGGPFESLIAELSVSLTIDDITSEDGEEPEDEEDP
ncbi:MAG: hypothetical protein Ta2B_22540 [Termitinemataceae bacterium]|nr:MAG: hypothetical protein Ta2B_22540 [Termitinemataceae bacterium]